MLTILIGGYFVIIKPRQDSSQKSSSATSDKNNQDYLAKKSELAKLDELSLVFKKVDSKNIAKLDKILPKKIDLEEMLKQMEVIVAQNGLLLNSMNVAKAADISPEVGSMTVNISVVGTSYTGLKTFLRTIENNLRLLDIKTLNFSPSGKSTNLDITAYYQK